MATTTKKTTRAGPREGKAGLEIGVIYKRNRVREEKEGGEGGRRRL